MTAVEPAIAMAASPRAWPQRLHRYVADHGGARIRGTFLTATDVLLEHYDVLVVDDGTSFLSHRLVTELHRAGRAVLGLYDPDDAHGKGELHGAGVDLTVPHDAPPEEIVGAAASLTSARPGLSTPAQQLPAPPPPGPAGPLVAVVGPPGGCGRSEVALGLAVALARRGLPTALVEGDEEGAALCARLGLPPYPNLRAALELARQGPGRSAQALQPLGDHLGAIVAGRIVAPGSGERLVVAPDDARAVLDDVGRGGRVVVVDVPRVAHPVLALRSPSAVVAVGAASPLGTLRLLEWVRRHGDVAHPPHVVLNRAPGSAFRRWEAAEALARVCPPASLTFVPEDRRVTDAVWRAAPVTRGAFVRAMEELTSRLLPQLATPTIGVAP